MSSGKLNDNVNNNDLDDNDVINANEDHFIHYDHNDHDNHDDVDVDVKDDDICVIDDKGDVDNVDDDDDQYENKSLHLFKVLQEMSSYHDYNDYTSHLNQIEARSSSSSSSSSCNLSIYNRNRNKIVWSMDRIRHIYKDYQLWPNFIGTKKIIFNEGDNIT